MTISSMNPLQLPLAAVQQLLECFGNQGVIIGGVAASVLGTPRLTADVDVVLLLSVSRLPELIDAAARLGLVPRIADAEHFARRNRVLLLRHEESGIGVDVSLGMLPFEEEVVSRGRTVQVGTIELRLPTPEDLIILKAVAHRPKDLLDISEVFRCHPDLDRARIEAWVREFAAALEMPELWADVAPLLEP
ncbi:MAG TPA: nucleotidyl transferase AbiEii/AbiGii toxin family protein [Anaerolineae bacterium]|nr:nucleotidyl transferase AbiEii/AbiGii toxin family protein [Anaerolineae bacterium]